MNSHGFDAGVHAAQGWRAVRRWAILLIGLTVFVEVHGVPALQTVYWADSTQVVYRARYWNVISGSRDVSRGELAPTLPILTLVPLERSLLEHAREALRDLTTYAENEDA